jgi:hypothetical protein
VHRDPRTYILFRNKWILGNGILISIYLSSSLNYQYELYTLLYILGLTENNVKLLALK